MTTKARAEATKIAAETEKLRLETEILERQLEQETIRAQKAIREDKRELSHNSQHRTYDFVQTVNDNSCEVAIQTLWMWARQSRDPITVRFSSPGGSVIDGFTLYDTITTLRQGGITINTVALGMAASMAAVLLQAGEKRIIGANTHILIHEVSSLALGKIGDLEDETKFVRKLNDRLFDILASRAKVKRATIVTRARRRDWWLNTEDCIKYGLADEVGGLYSA